MKENGIFGTNFTSRVKVMEDFYSTPEEFLGKKEASTLKRALRTLEQSETNDTVKVFLLDGSEDAKIGLKVERDIEGKKYAGKSVIALFCTDLKTKNVYEAYKKALKEANSMRTPVKKSGLDEFI